MYNCCLVLLVLVTKVVLGRHANNDISSLDIHNVNCEHGNPSCHCRENADVCHFRFIIKGQMLMTPYRVNEELNEKRVEGTVYYFDNNGTLQPHPESGPICANIPIGDRRCTPIATADAATYRPYISINGLSPGTNLFMKTRQVTSTLQISSLMHVKF